MISQYYLEQIPARPLVIQVKFQDGTDANLLGYDTISARMVGSNNEEISLTGSTLVTTQASEGKITFRWPTDRSLFHYVGDYLLQIELKGTDRRDFTSTHTIRVREFGGAIR
jgi:hypothetical protein